MCFIALAYEQNARYRLVMATNRDEFYDRPTTAATFWDEAPDLLAGRDLKGGGTWLGVTKTGRFAALTNFREFGTARSDQPQAPTRGLLVSNYLASEHEPEAYLEDVGRKADEYNGFNLLVGDKDDLYYFSNRELRIRKLTPGIYGLSNHLLDTPWPKVQRGKTVLQATLDSDEIDPEALFRFLLDDRQASDDALPDTGIGLAWERILSPIFIKSPRYGTRASTIVLMEYTGRVSLIERTYHPGEDRREGVTRSYTFKIMEGTPRPISDGKG
ncbi:MAG: NRDE family protein [Rhodothermales bacterium]